MNGDNFAWPDDPDECVDLARSMFISACTSNARYWIDWGSHLLTSPQPEKPYARSWSAAAKEDRAFREVFATLTEPQRTKVIELLGRCANGAVFSTLCILDEFPHGDMEILVRDSASENSTRSFRIAPMRQELHDEFSAAAMKPSADPGHGT